MERSHLRLWHLAGFSEDLAAGGLEESGLRRDLSDRFEDPGDAHREHHGGQDRLLERRCEDRIGGEVVYLVGMVIAKDLFEAVLVEQIILDDLDPAKEMPDPVDVDGIAVRHRADHPVPFVQEELGKIRPVLAADACDQRGGHYLFMRTGGYPWPFAILLSLKYDRK